jgi:hypothetical protein
LKDFNENCFVVMVGGSTYKDKCPKKIPCSGCEMEKFYAHNPSKLIK